LVAMTENIDRFASGDPPIPGVFVPAAGLPVVPAIPLHLAAVAAPFTSPFCPVCVVCRSYSSFCLYSIYCQSTIRGEAGWLG